MVNTMQKVFQMYVCMNYKCLNISERIDINKTNESKECDICHYCYCLDKSFNY